jgi:hypothetical protein
MASGGTLPVRTGSFTSDGALISVESVGFRPKRVTFVNESNAAIGEWQDSMDDDSVRTSEGGTDAFATSGGVIPLDNGFSLGVNAVLNTATEVIHWTAIG